MSFDNLRALVSLVTVVIPTRDRPVMAARAVACAIGQRGLEVEVVVVDDGSRSAVRSRLAQLAASIDELRVIRHDEPRGVSAARNTGIETASAGWVAFLDDDDVWAPTKLEEQIATADAQGVDWVYSGAVGLDERLQVVGGGRAPDTDDIARQLLVRNALPAGSSNVLVRRSVMREVGGFDEELKHMADWDMWIRLALHTRPGSVQRPLVGYVLHPRNASLEIGGILEELGIIESKWASARGAVPVDRAYVHRWMAWSALRRGRRAIAMRSYWAAAREGDALSIGRLASALVLPRGYAPIRSGPSPFWVEQAEQWLGRLRENHGNGGGGPTPTAVHPVPRDRSRLPESRVRRIREERIHPRWTQWDYLHLRGVRDGVAAAVAGNESVAPSGPTLDLYCGSKPYASILPAPCWGFDLDDHFGGADVIGAEPLPFQHGAFRFVVITQALHLVADPVATAREVARVTAPGGVAVITVPTLFRRDLPYERRLGQADLTGLFAGWSHVLVSPIGGPATGLVYIVGKVLSGVIRRWPALQIVLPPAFLALNGVGALMELLSKRLAPRWPALLLLIASEPPQTGVRLPHE